MKLPESGSDLEVDGPGRCEAAVGRDTTTRRDSMRSAVGRHRGSTMTARGDHYVTGGVAVMKTIADQDLPDRITRVCGALKPCHIASTSSGGDL